MTDTVEEDTTENHEPPQPYFRCHACGCRRESMVEYVCDECGHDNSEDSSDY